MIDQRHSPPELRDLGPLPDWLGADERFGHRPETVDLKVAFVRSRLGKNRTGDPVRVRKRAGKIEQRDVVDHEIADRYRNRELLFAIEDEQRHGQTSWVLFMTFPLCAFQNLVEIG